MCGSGVALVGDAAVSLGAIGRPYGQGVSLLGEKVRGLYARHELVRARCPLPVTRPVVHRSGMVELQVQMLVYEMGGRWFGHCPDLAWNSESETPGEAFDFLLDGVWSAVARGSLLDFNKVSYDHMWAPLEGASLWRKLDYSWYRISGEEQSRIRTDPILYFSWRKL